MGTIRIITYNVNGIRAAIKKGLLDWLASFSADIVCIQETKAEKEQVNKELIDRMGYEQFWFSATVKKGYSGVAVFSRIKPDLVEYGHGHGASDGEGRVIQLNIGDLRLINAYFPSGTSGEERQGFKYQWLEDFRRYLDELKKSYPRMVLCGDYNIAHQPIDIHDPKGNKNSSGFLPEERAWMNRFLASGWTDTLRTLRPEAGQYSWWSQRFPSVRAQNKGWRIDYINVTDNLNDRIVEARILPDAVHSDHCPVLLEIKM